MEPNSTTPPAQDTAEYEAGRRARAVIVAQDVLKHLDLLTLTESSYFNVSITEDHAVALTKKWDTGDLQEVADELTPFCEVCLLGACVLSKARVFDQVKLKTLFGYDQAHTHFGVISGNIYAALADVFSPETRQLLEACFEMDPSFAPFNTKRARDAACYGRDLNSAYRAANSAYISLDAKRKNRVRVAMENVIANGGEFVPPTYPDEDLNKI